MTNQTDADRAALYPAAPADHPHTDPGDGRTECQTCGKWVWPVIHSCKGVPVTARARAGQAAAPYTDSDVDLVRAAIRDAPCPACGRTRACRCRLTDEQAGYRWRAVLDALAAAGRLASGAGQPKTPAYVHHLLDAFLAGQPLNFHGDPVPLDVQRRLAHAVANGQMGTVLTESGEPAHHHGAGGYRTGAAPGRHVLDVDAIGWTIHHPTACTITPRTGGQPAVICLVDETARTELAAARLTTGLYEVWAADEPDHAGGHLRIGDRLDDTTPLPAGARTASTCRCEDPGGRQHPHAHGTGLVCGQKGEG